MNIVLKKFPLFVVCALVAASSILVLPVSLFDRFEYPKYLSFLVLTFVLVVYHLIFSSWQRLKNLPFSIWIFLGFLFLGQLLAFVFSTDESLSFGGALFRYEGYVTQIFYILLFFCSFLFFENSSETESQSVFSFLTLLLGVVTGFAVISLTHFFPLFDPATFENRIFGTLGNPNYLASFLVALFPFFVFQFQHRPRVLWSGGTFFLGALLLTGSRSALLALLVSGLFGLFVFSKKVERKKLFAGIKKLGIAVVCIVLFVLPWQHSLQRFSFHSQNFTSFGTRFDLWKAGIHLYGQHPFTGVGQDMIEQNISPFLPDHIRLNTDSYVDRVHSEPLDILVMSGPITVIGYLGLFGVLCVSTFRNKKKSLDVTVPTLFSLFILFMYHLVNFSTITTNVLWYFLLGFLAFKIVDQTKVSTDNFSKNLNCDILST